MKKIVFMLSTFAIVLSANSFNFVIQEYIDTLKNEAKSLDSSFVDFDIKRGEEIFTTSHIGKKGEKISCTTCHSIDLTSKGKNISTNKIIEPLAPSVNPKRLTNLKDVEKWLRRNFKDVYNKEGTALQKGDVLYYINSK